MSKTSPIIVNEIRRLSQEEGLKDNEIAEIIQYNRVSVQRIRTENKIPSYNEERRKDKKCKCVNCLKEFFIRRCEDKENFCEECKKKIDAQFHRQF